jgi:amino acid adenylation domain-containing protein
MTTPESEEFAELPLSYAQERLWFIDRLVPGSPAYNVPAAIELAGALDRAAWARALGETRRRHEALRTTFAETPDGVVQRIAVPAAAALPLPEVDLAALPAAVGRGEADRLVAEEARRPFDLVRGPLLRAALVALGGRRAITLMTVHHIVADGWSISVLLDELATLYAAFASGRPSPLPALALQYGDYAVWQREWLTPEILSEPLAHFDAVLAGVPPLLALPADRPRPPLQSFRGCRRAIDLPVGLMARLGRLGREVGATPFMTLLAALAALLHRLSGAAAIPIGLPVAGRGRTELEELIGLFVNTVVVCPRIAPGGTFRELLARVRDEALAAYDREHLPFEKLVEARKAGAALSHNPIFQVLFGYHVEATELPRFAGLESEFLEADLGVAHADLALSAEPAEGGLTASLELATDLFDPATGARLLAEWRELLDGAAGDAAQRVAELPLLGAAERHQLLAEWNDTTWGAAPPDAEGTARLERLFERQAAAAPERVAIDGAGGAVTYGELDRRASALAGALRRLGLGPEAPIAILLPRAPEAVVAILGALKVGGAYLPLDPTYPRQRLAAMLADAGRPALLTRRGLEPGLDLSAEAGAVVFLDDLATGAAGEEAPVPPPHPPATVDGLAYVLYTSGSTGRPKGVGCTHRGAANLLAEMARRRPLAAGHGASLWTSLSFDVSVYEIFEPLASGGRLEIPPDAVRPDAAALLGWIEDRRIECAYLPPFALGELARRLEAGCGTPLARLLVGVEPIPEPLLARIARLAPGLAVINGYGPTEATICCTLHAVDPSAAGEGTTPVGRPLAETRIHLLDRDLQPVPIGVPGELCVAGWGLARGYLGRPEATAERFLPDPFSGLHGAAPGGRLYRTGDLARRRTDGACEFLGRIDHQIKLRGFRIEPEEVETALATHPAVTAAAVARRDDGPAGRRLGAYVVLASGLAIAPTDLAEHLRARLPAHMVPAEWTAVEALPLTPQGKLDRRALPRAVPRPWPAGGRASAPYVAPRTPVEEALAAIWAELLGRERVGVHDDFFAAGGHSLLAAEATARVRQALAVELPAAALFAAPTPASLGRWIEQAVEAPAPPALMPRAPLASRAPDPPLSFAQERLWLVDQLRPGATYNLPFALDLAGPLDPAAWAASVAAVRRRHEALRTRFRAVLQAPAGREREEEGGAVQVIDPAGSPFPGTALLDLSGLPGPARAAEEARRTAEEARRPFDLAAGPLLRSALLRLAPAEHRALLSFHHIVSDGWSTSVLLAELEALYGAFAAGATPALPALPLQYADYALWQRRWLSGEVLERQLAYWRERLAGDLTLELPADRLRPSREARGEIRGGEIPAALPAALAERLARLGRDAGATPFMTLLAAFAALLHRLTGRAAIAVGAPVANRDRPEIAGLIGFFANTLVLVADLSGDPSFAALLARVREAALGAYAHQDLPFDKLVAELRPERHLDDNPLFRVVFAFHRPLPRLAAGGLSGTARQVHNGTAKFDLLLALTEEDAGLSGAWEYRADLFDRATVARFSSALAHLLADADAHPERPVSRLDLLDEAARHQLTREWNDRAADFPRQATLAERFARQAARTPERAALLGPAAGEEMSYGELDSRSTALARRLAARGVGPEVRVALLLGRSVDLLVAILATVKAGGAYVPLDPAYPTARLVFMLGDSRAGVLVTHRGLAARLGATGLSTLDLDVDPGLDAPAAEAGEPLAAASADNLAYVMYTSGSTGRPKGVGATHRNVIRLVEGASYVRFGPEQVFLQLAPPSFDASTLEIWGPLLHGGRLAIAAEGRTSLAELSAMIREHGISTLWLTTGLFHQMVDEELAGLVPLAQLMTGGDALSPLRVRAALARLCATAVVNFYGPTEGTTFASCEPLRDGGAPGAAVPIGRPIDNARIHVLDERLARVPIGVPGELYVGGDGVARGYLDRPELTAERFLPDPWPATPGERLYRTGDRVRCLADGRIDFLGRTDAQVKIAGQRIEPGEVETALARHPRVLQCAVAVEGEGADDKRLVAFAITDADDRDSLRSGPRSLRAWLAERLPEAMVPARVLLLDELPLNANGKIDRAALARLAAGSEEGEGREAPRAPVHDPLVELLLGIFAEVLGRERVGVDDSFFNLGGHSLLGTRLVARVRHLCGIDLSLRALFEEPTVAGLAARIGQVQGGPLQPLIAAPRPRDRAYLAPASLAQRRLWFLQRLAPAGFFLNVPHALRLRGDLAAPVLAHCLTEIAARHEPLRTTFVTEGGQPMQRIAPASPLALPCADLTELPAARRGAPPPGALPGEGARGAAREVEARHLARSVAERPFDPARGPLLRALLVRLGPADHLLVLVPHHLAFDGWSMGVLFRELAELYGAFVLGRPSPLAPLPVAYSDFADWQRRALAGEARERQLDYWRERLAGLPALDLPTDRPRPPVPPFRGGGIALALPPALAVALAALCRHQGVTLFMALLAAWELVLTHLSGQRDFPVGVPVAGRSRPEVEELIGFFVNTLVLRADLSGEPRLADLLARTREAALGAYAHQDLPFEEVVLALKPERHAAVNPLFDVALSLDEAPAPAALPGLSAEPFEFAADIAHFELTLVASRAPAARGGGITLALNYRRDLFDRTTAARLVEGLASLLEAAVAAPQSPALALPFWSEAARHQVLREWNEGSEPENVPAAGDTVDRLVARAAALAPQALAVGGHGGSLSYGELADRAGRLRERLRRAGVGPGARVALVLDRSPELALAALAVLAAGAAYLPLDPGLPAARLAEIVADSAAAAVVARGAALARLAGCRARLLPVEEAGIARGTAEPAPAPHGPGDLAYVIYTSGSTGRPKGVELTHGGLANLVAWHRDRYRVTAADRASWVASPGFDASVWELWPYLAAGASLHPLPPEVARSPRELLAWLAETGVTIAFLPTPLAEAVLRLPRPPGLALRALLTGGDRLRQAPPGDLGFPLVNHYGPTESTVVATAGTIGSDPPSAHPAPPAIGRPIAGLAGHLLDRDLRPVPVGGRGEICLGGRGLARGYLGLPALTAQRFVPHPFAERPGMRLYCTGDLARLLPDGRIDFLGRADGQVKVRGFRVELGEVEARLATHPEVREAAVVVDPSPAGDRLVACVVPRSAGAAPAAALREHLRAALPDYMVPALFASVDALPLTPQGKLDRAALPALALSGAGGAEPVPPAALDAPNGRIELLLAGLWREVLKLPDAAARLGAEDNFFDLGGQSLALVAVHERLQAELEIELPLVELFEHTTIRSLAARLAGLPPAEPAPEELAGLAARAERQRNAPAWKERARQARRQPDHRGTP